MLTDQQTAFIQAVNDNPRQSYLLQALAGTGKTTTLIEACPNTPTLALAFNKRIQQELARKFPKSANCLTFNGLGHRTWARGLSSRPVVQQNKVYKLTRATLEDADAEPFYWKNLGDIMKLVNAARTIGLAHKANANYAKPLADDKPEVWQALCYENELSDSLIEYARQVLFYSTRAAFEGEIDFQDQLYMPVVFRAPFPRGQYANVIVDEAQDLGPLEHKMVELCLNRNSRLIAAGDKHQAIYGFKGAYSDSMDRLAEKTDAVEMPLTLTFRCPHAVVQEAQQYVPEYEAADSAPEGSVETWSTVSTEYFTGGSQTAILCRYNAPLFNIAMKLIQQRTPCKMLGRDVGTSIKRILGDVANEDDAVEDIIPRIYSWVDEKIEAYQAKGDFNKVMQMQDRGESLLAVCKGCQRAYEVYATINDLFGQKSTGITLSTIHKAKGLEWDKVIYYLQETPDAPQEDNLHYVAITRSQRSLIYLVEGT